jgi:hypothetical protein
VGAFVREPTVMLKKVMLISAIAAMSLVGLSTNPLRAGDSGCADAAKARFPNDHAARKDFKHWCKDQWKIYKKSNLSH